MACSASCRSGPHNGIFVALRYRAAEGGAAQRRARPRRVAATGRFRAQADAVLEDVAVQRGFFGRFRQRGRRCDAGLAVEMAGSDCAPSSRSSSTSQRRRAQRGSSNPGLEKGGGHAKSAFQNRWMRGKIVQCVRSARQNSVRQPGGRQEESSASRARTVLFTVPSSRSGCSHRNLFFSPCAALLAELRPAATRPHSASIILPILEFIELVPVARNVDAQLPEYLPLAPVPRLPRWGGARLPPRSHLPSSGVPRHHRISASPRRIGPPCCARRSMVQVVGPAGGGPSSAARGRRHGQDQGRREAAACVASPFEARASSEQFSQ